MLVSTGLTSNIIQCNERFEPVTFIKKHFFHSNASDFLENLKMLFDNIDEVINTDCLKKADELSL